MSIREKSRKSSQESSSRVDSDSEYKDSTYLARNTEGYPEEYEETSNKKYRSTGKTKKLSGPKINRFEDEFKNNDLICQNNIKTSISNENEINQISDYKEKLTKENGCESRMEIVNFIFKILNQHQIPELFFQSVNIYDNCLLKTTKSNSNGRVLLAGISILIAAKYQQVSSETFDDLYELFEFLFRDKFDRGDILNLEKKYLKLIGTETLRQKTLEDYVNSFLVDLWVNHNEILVKSRFYEKLKETAHYFAKIMLHYQYYPPMNAAFYCVVAAYNFAMLKCSVNSPYEKQLNKEFIDWGNKYKEERVLRIVNVKKTVKMILEQYENYQRNDVIKIKNVNKYCPLSFLKKCE